MVVPVAVMTSSQIPISPRALTARAAIFAF
jgi:hypothetical protein